MELLVLIGGNLYLADCDKILTRSFFGEYIKGHGGNSLISSVKLRY